jgi:hypothetical protein
MERYQHKAKLAFVILDDDGWIRIQICTKKNKGKLDCWIVNKKCMQCIEGACNIEVPIRKQMTTVYLSLQPS